MKQLFLKITVITAAFILIFTIIWFLPGTYPHDLAAVVNKVEMLKKKKSPRLIFVGGSSLLTLRSSDIVKATGYPVVNLGMWGGLGAEQYLDEIRPYIKEGDIIVITMEYGTSLDHRYWDYIYTNSESKKFRFLLSPMKHIARYMDRGEYFNIFKTILELCQLKFRCYIQNIFFLEFGKLCQNGYQSYDEQFDKNGDRTRPFKILPKLDESDKEYNMPYMERHHFLNEFNDYAKRKKARMLFYFSHIPAEEYNLNRYQIESFHKGIKDLLRFTIINTPKDFVFPRNYFADTIYHLNEKGEKIRTKKLIQMLKKEL